MKKLCFLIFALFFSILQSQAVYALDIPRLTGYVNDYAGMMSQDEKDRIARDLELYEKSTSTQIFILTIPSLEGMPIEDFSIKVAESWKAGQKGKDNGIIITIAKADGKIRIEVGRGLEGSVTDLVSGRIIREEMSPKLKAGNTAEALETAVAKIKLAAKGEYKGDETKKNTSSDGEWLMPLLGYVFILFIAGVVGIAIELLGGIVGICSSLNLNHSDFNDSCNFHNQTIFSVILEVSDCI